MTIPQTCFRWRGVGSHSTMLNHPVVLELCSEAVGWYGFGLWLLTIYYSLLTIAVLDQGWILVGCKEYGL